MSVEQTQGALPRSPDPSCAAPTAPNGHKDIFKGKVLIDRLLQYYAKFDGSRDRAVRYAQKLLDLGHIESLSCAEEFDDSAHVYRWTDAAAVISAAKSRDEGGKPVAAARRNSPGRASQRRSSPEGGGGALVKISIETADGGKGTEIKAHITTSPRGASHVNQTDQSEWKLMDDNHQRLSPQRKDVERNFPRSPEIANFEWATSPRKAPSTLNARRDTFDVASPGNRQFDDLSEMEADDDFAAAYPSSPRKRVVRTGFNSNYPTMRAGPGTEVGVNGWAKVDTSNVDVDTSTATVDKNAVNGTNGSTNRSAVRFAYTQTSEASLLMTSSSGGVKVNGSNNSRESDEEDADDTERRNPRNQTVDSKHVNGSCDVTDDRVGISYEQNHAGGMRNQQFRRELEELCIVIPKIALPTPPPSPKHPPPSPMSTASNGHVTQGLKSLFWDKITCVRSSESEDDQATFWQKIAGPIPSFDVDDFERLFRKANPATAKREPASGSTTRGEGAGVRADGGGGTIKVLSTERSRQIGIRVSSVHVPVEEIHDAVIGMLDDKLDLDALQAIYDMRPTPQEVDGIAEALKQNPRGILEKSEQFVLMLAMIPNVDDRLKCWIFAKRFPEQMVEIQEQLNLVNEACVQVTQNELLGKAMEIVLTLGNHMNSGTQRGSADGFRLDILPKLKDVKSQDGKTNLLNYVVHLIRSGGEIEEDETSADQKQQPAATPRLDRNCRLPDQDLLQKTSSVLLADIGDELERTATELDACKTRHVPAVLKGSTLDDEVEVFDVWMGGFLQRATTKLRELAIFYKETLMAAESFQDYYQVCENQDGKRETFQTTLKSISSFCDDFRQRWICEEKLRIKEEFCKMEKGRKSRQASLAIQSSPTALKRRFLDMQKKREGLRRTDDANPADAV